jgi:hypothetical protein
MEGSLRYAILLVLLSVFCAGQSQSHERSHGSQDASSPSALRWSPIEIPNVSLAVVSGNPSAQGAVVLRVRADKQAQIPPYSLANDEQLTVVSGAPRLGEGDHFSATALRTLHAGESVALTKGTRYFAMLHAGDEIEIRGEGPFGFNWVDPKSVKARSKTKDVQSVSERTKEKREQDKP